MGPDCSKTWCISPIQYRRFVNTHLLLIFWIKCRIKSLSFMTNCTISWQILTHNEIAWCCFMLDWPPISDEVFLLRNFWPMAVFWSVVCKLLHICCYLYSVHFRPRTTPNNKQNMVTYVTFSSSSPSGSINCAQLNHN